MFADKTEWTKAKSGKDFARKFFEKNPDLLEDPRTWQAGLGVQFEEGKWSYYHPGEFGYMMPDTIRATFSPEVLAAMQKLQDFGQPHGL
jgi:hypothetical protein